MVKLIKFMYQKHTCAAYSKVELECSPSILTVVLSCGLTKDTIYNEIVKLLILGPHKLISYFIFQICVFWW